MKKHILALSLLLVFPTASVLGDQHLPSSPDPGPLTLTLKVNNNTNKAIDVQCAYVRKSGEVYLAGGYMNPGEPDTFELDDPLLPSPGFDLYITAYDDSMSRSLRDYVHYHGLIKDDIAAIICEDNKYLGRVECYVNNK